MSTEQDYLIRGTAAEGHEEIESMIRDKKPIELHCHFCNSNYVFSVKELEDLIS